MSNRNIVGQIWLSAGFVVGSLATTPLQHALAACALLLGAIIVVHEWRNRR